MEIKTKEVDQAIGICEEFLKSTSTFNTPIEAYLVQYLLILICREFEWNIKEIFSELSNLTDNEKIKNYIISSVDKTYRGLKITELYYLTGLCGIECKDNLKMYIEKNANVQISYDNIITNRNSVAHREGVQITFNELKINYGNGLRIIEKINEILHENRKKTE